MCLIAKLVSSDSSFAMMVVPCVVQLCQVLPLCPRHVCNPLSFFFFLLHLSNAAFVIAWCSGGEKIGAKEYFCISAVVHPYLLLIYRFCFPLWICLVYSKQCCADALACSYTSGK